MLLPAEIRLAIWRMVLCDPEPLAIDAHVPALLTVCRQLRQEGGEVYYEHNTFNIVIFGDAYLEDGSTRLKHGWDVGMLLEMEELRVPPSLRRARKLQVILRGSQRDDFIDHGDSFDDRQAIHQLCALMRDVIQPQRTTISIHIDYN